MGYSMSIKSKFCPECGKTVNNLYESNCIDCYAENSKVKIPNKKNVLFCVKCEQIFNKGFWTNGDSNKILLDRIKKSVILPEKEKLISVRFGDDESSIKIKSKLESELIVRDVKGKFEVKKYCCPACSREMGVDYLAKLQLRSKDPNFVENALNYIRSSKPKISKVEYVAAGADIYLVNQQIARQASRRIKKHFNCHIKASYKAYGWDKEKDRPKQRITILLKQKERN
tara:strand:- start:1809 stop:2492 length:684 start_codon:yes stop_codon:yes gene_type:complete